MKLVEFTCDYCLLPMAKDDRWYRASIEVPEQGAKDIHVECWEPFIVKEIPKLFQRIAFTLDAGQADRVTVSVERATHDRD